MVSWNSTVIDRHVELQNKACIFYSSASSKCFREPCGYRKDICHLMAIKYAKFITVWSYFSQKIWKLELRCFTRFLQSSSGVPRKELHRILKRRLGEKVTEWVELEGTTEGILVQPPAQARLF